MNDNQKRTILKTISFRIVASLLTVIIVYIFTKELIISFGVGIVEAISKMIFYYIHERIWDKINWGKF